MGNMCHDQETVCKNAKGNQHTYDMRVRPAKFPVRTWVCFFLMHAGSATGPKWKRNHTGSFLVTNDLSPLTTMIQKSRTANSSIYATELKAKSGAGVFINIEQKIVRAELSGSIVTIRFPWQQTIAMVPSVGTTVRRRTLNGEPAADIPMRLTNLHILLIDEDTRSAPVPKYL